MSVQSLFQVENQAEFRDLCNSCGYEVRDDAEFGLSIVRWTEKSNNDITPPIKGLIFESATGKIVAPGVHIPRSEPTSDVEVIGYSPALDGVMFRGYFWNGSWRFSTNGSIIPGSWGNVSFDEMLSELIVKYENSIQAWNKDNCYFFVMEHTSHPNLYMPKENLLTLVRVLTLDGLPAEHQEKYNFKILPFVEGDETDYLMALQDMDLSNCCTGPVDQDKFGLVVYYADGTTCRVLSKLGDQADSLMPNFPTVQQHWVFHVLNYLPEEVDYTGVAWYKNMFPWNAPMIERLNAWYKTHPNDSSNPISMKKLADDCLRAMA